jgi:hypothetical protein
MSMDFEVGMLALVKWWSGLQERISSMWLPNSYSSREEQPPAPGLDEAESAMRRVRLALAAVITDTLPEFLRSYRVWTRSIAEMGRKGWPGVDWTYLDQAV